MKTILVLEKEEIARITGGEPLALHLADGSSITIQAEKDGETDPVQQRGNRRQKPGGRYRCGGCGETFANRFAIGGHAKGCAKCKKKGADARSTIGEKLLACSEPGCGRRFVHQAWMERHREREHGKS